MAQKVAETRANPLVIQRTPFHVEQRPMEVPMGATVSDMLALASITSPLLLGQITVHVGDWEIPRENWQRVAPKAGAVVHVKVRMAGGGGGGGKKNPLASVLQLALVVAAFVVVGPMAANFLGPLLPGFAGGMFATNFVLQAASVLATTATLTIGQALIGAIAPPPSQKGQYGFDQQLGNPYGQLTGLQNRAAPYGPIPRVYGTRRMYPMIAARPYTESQGSDSYLRLLLLVGYGPLKIEDIMLGETPLEDFTNVQVEIREGWQDDAPVTLFTDTIHELGFDVLLQNQGDSGIQTTRTDTDEISIDVTAPGGFRSFDSKGDHHTANADFTVQYRPVGTSEWLTPAWITHDRTLGTRDNGTLNFNADSGSAIVRSARWKPAAGRGQYDVKITRATPPGTPDNRFTDICYWTCLRSVEYTNPVTMPGMALIAMRMKANGQLSGVPQTINCIASSYLQTPRSDGSFGALTDKSSWSLSRSPAWAFRDLLRRRGATELFPDARIDIDTLKVWDAEASGAAPTGAGPRWAFDAVFEGGSIFAALQQVASHGRASFAFNNGLYSVSRDVPQTVPVQHITPRNSANYNGAKTFLEVPDALRVKFINAAKRYAQDEVIVYRDGFNESTAKLYQTIELNACTSADQAHREGRYYLAVILLRPETHMVTMDIENLRCTKGSLVRFSHDVVAIGLGSGRVVAREAGGAPDGSYAGLQLDSAVPMEAGKSYAMRVRRLDGTSTMCSLVNTATGADPVYSDVVQFVAPMSDALCPEGGDLYQFGEAGEESAPMLVAKIEPSSDLTATLTLVDAQDGVWTADTTAIPAFDSHITQPYPLALPPAPAKPTFSLASGNPVMKVLADGTVVDRIAVNMLSPSFTDVHVVAYDVSYRLTGTADWTPLPRIADSRSAMIEPVEAGLDYDVQVRAIGERGASDWQVQTGYTALGKTSNPLDVQSFAAVRGLAEVRLSWAHNAEVAAISYTVKQQTTDGDGAWEAGIPVVSGYKGDSLAVPLHSTNAITFLIRATDAVGNESSIAAAAVAQIDLAGIPVPGAGSWSAAAATVTEGESSIPAITVVGGKDSDNVSAILVDFVRSGASAATLSFPPNTTRMELTGLYPETAYDVRVRYASLAKLDNPAAYLDLGTFTTGKIVAGDVTSIGGVNITALLASLQTLNQADIPHLLSNVQAAEEAALAAGEAALQAALQQASQFIDLHRRDFTTDGYPTPDAILQSQKDIVAALADIAAVRGELGDLGTTVNGDIATTIQQLTTQIADATFSLQQSINGVSSNLTTNYYTKVGTDAALTAMTTALQSNIDGVSSNLANNYYTKAGADGAISAANLSLHGTVTAEIGVVSSNLTNNYYTKAGTDGAISAANLTLHGTITGEIGVVSANLANNYYTKAGVDGAISAADLALHSTVTGEIGAVSSDLHNNYYTATSTNAAIAAASLTLQSNINGVSSNLSNNYYTKAGVDGAINAASLSLQSNINGVSSNLSNNYYTKAGTDGAISAANLTLHSTITGEIGVVSANLSNNYYTKAGVDGAISAASLTLQNSINGVSANLTNNYYTSVQTNSAISAANLALHSTITGEIGVVSANLSNNYYTAASTDAAISAATLSLHNQIVNGDNTIYASLTNYYYTSVQTDSAISTAGLTLQSHINDVSANLTNNYWTATTTNSAIAFTATNLQAAIRDGDSTVSADLHNNYYTGATTDAAIAAASLSLHGTITGEIGVVSANLSNNYYTKAGVDGAISTASLGLQGQITNGDNTIYASLTNYYFTSAQTNAAISAAGLALHSTITGEIGVVSANLTNNYYTAASTNAAISAASLALQSNINGVSSNLSNNYYTKAGTDGAISTASLALQANINGLQSTLYNNFYTAVSTNTAIAAASSVLQASIDGVSANVSTQASAIATLQGRSATWLTTVGVDGGGRATVALHTDSSGASTIQLVANQVFFGANLEADEANNRFLVRDAGGNIVVELGYLA